MQELYHETLMVNINAEKKRSYYPIAKEDTEELNNCKFSYFKKFNPEIFDCTTTDDMVVPSCWQRKGYDYDQYTNTRFPFPYDPPYILKDNPCGVYDFEYTLKSNKEKHYIAFFGVDSCFYLFVNGSFVGYSTISHSFNEFDITSFLKEKNVIRVVVLKWCQASYLEDQDKLRMSGIFGKVEIYHRPKDHLGDYSVKTDVDGNIGKISLLADKACEVSLYDEGILLDKKTGKNVSFSINEVKLWNAENPKLYTLVLSYNGEIITEKVGIRKVEVKDGVLLINNRAVKFKGVNRHSMTINGYTETEEDIKKDLIILKEHNVNAIRTSHYPPHYMLPRLCDEMGLYLILEADVETHGTVCVDGGYDFKKFADISDDPQFEEQMVSRMLSAYERDKNRASVVIWSLGNESGYGKNFWAMSKALKNIDQSLIIHYEGMWNYSEGKYYSEEVTDINSRMYPDYEWLRNYQDKKPIVLCEYTHAMGNSCGDVRDYWEIIYNNPQICGAFVWEYCSHSVITEDGKILYGGDFGEKFHDGNFCMDGLVQMDRTPNPSFSEVKEVYAPMDAKYENGTLTIINRQDFNTLDGYTCRYFFTVDGEVVESDKINILGIEAGKELTLTLESPIKKGYLALGVVFEKDKKEVCQRQFVLNDQFESVKTDSLEKIQIKETDKLIGVDNFILDAQPICMRAPIDNDMYYKNRWREFGVKDAQYFVRERKKIDNTLSIIGAMVCDGRRTIADVDMEIKDLTTAILITTKVNIRAQVESLPRFGISLTLNPNFCVGEYFGRGMGEAYVDRKLAEPIGLYPLSKESYMYPKPQESGSHVDTRFVVLTDGKDNYMVDGENNFSFSLTPYALSDYKAHAYEMENTGRLYLNIDYKMSGVGSNSCGPMTQLKYMLTEKQFSWSFTVKKLKKGVDVFGAHRQKL